METRHVDDRGPWPGYYVHTFPGDDREMTGSQDLHRGSQVHINPLSKIHFQSQLSLTLYLHQPKPNAILTCTGAGTYSADTVKAVPLFQVSKSK